MQNDNVNQIDQLLNSRIPIMLFIGKEPKDIDPSILALPWSCVVTTSVDVSLQYCFEIKDKRRPIVITNSHDMLGSAKLNQRELNIVYLYGEEDQSNLSAINKQRKKNNALDMLKIIPDMLNSAFGALFVINYNPDYKDEIQFENLIDTVDSIKNKPVYFFGISQQLANNQLFNEMQAENCIVGDTGELQDLVELTDEQDDLLEEGELLDDDKVYYYSNGKRHSITTGELFETKSFAKLLNETEIGIINFPNHLRNDYFYHFLKESAKRPIWFGYENHFNLVRDYERKLNDLVYASLNSKEIKQKPILVLGQTSSSKSIVLSNLAYTLFKAHDHPVVFINNKDISFDINSSNFNALDSLLYKIEEHGATRVVLIWDNSSSSVNEITATEKLYTGLINRGRKVVLISSAYQQINIYRNKIDKFFKVINAEIKLSKEEKERLSELVLSNSRVPQDVFQRWIQSEHEDNLLTLLYSLLMEYTGSGIIQGVKNEIDKGMSSLLNALSKLPKQAERNKTSILAQAFADAGYKLKGHSGGAPSTIDIETIEHSLREFCKIVAISYQHNIMLPVYLVVKCSGLDIDSNFYLIQETLFSIPFLKVITREEDSSDFDYAIGFRTPLEANLYLKSIETTPEQEIACITNLILNISHSNQYSKFSEVSSIDKLIRTIGPNTIKPEVRTRYRSYYYKVIDALQELRAQSKIFDPKLICQEVTWVREVYGNQIEQEFEYELRVNKLQEASVLANKTLSNLESPNITYHELITRHNLIVETAFIEWKLYELVKQNTSSSSDSSSQITFNYDELLNSLKEVIYNDPTNSYPANALLKLFKALYLNNNINTQNKLKYLDEILTIINNIDNATDEAFIDNEEYLEHKSHVIEYLSSKKYEKYLDELIAAAPSVGLHLKARKLIVNANIDVKKPLDNNQILVAHEIITMLNKNEESVSKHEGCLLLKLNLLWLIYNDSPIFTGKEKQFTQMNLEHWKDINKICRQYEEHILKSGKNQVNSPFMYYLLGLSYAQIEDYPSSNEAFKKIKESLFFRQVRNKVWHIICDENGVPKKFRGSLSENYYDSSTRKGFAKLEAIHTSKGGVFFYGPNMKTAKYSGSFSDIEVGTSYIGFEAFRKLEENK
ncbi:MAG: hypothetical protein AB7E76_06750 [Deferribacterales bacterium]